MKKIFYVLILMFCVSFVNINAQNFVKQGNTFVQQKSERSSAPAKKTQFIYEDTKGNKYPIYISGNGSCFVIKTSAKTGKEYRKYLGAEISEEICNQLGVKYNGKKNEKK
jgi:hypothetical protein